MIILAFWAPMYEAFHLIPTVGKYARSHLSRHVSPWLHQLRQSSTNNDHHHGNHGGRGNNNKNDPSIEMRRARPPIVVWKYNAESQNWEQHGKSMALHELPLAVQQTWAWCQNFVLPLELCPWARASLTTAQALQIFLVDQEQHSITDNASDEFYYALVDDVGRRFEDFLGKQPESIESAAIFFVVFVDSERSGMKAFGDFFNWFDLLEETWGLLDTVIVAPFHPEWSFEGEPESLHFEKRSPHPTVTLVSARVVDAAGEAATQQIGKHNEQVLLSKTVEELRDLWNRCLEPAASDDEYTSGGP